MDYSTVLQSSIRQFIEEHLSCNVEQMAKHIYQEHAHFQKINYPVFKKTVKTALEYIQFVDNIEGVAAKEKDDILPYMHESGKFTPSNQGKKVAAVKAERQKRKRELKKKPKSPSKDDCFIIDVEGNHTETSNAEISIVYSNEQQPRCPTPLSVAAKSTPVSTSSARKRPLLDDASDKQHKKLMLSKMLAEKVQDFKLSQLGGLDLIIEPVYSVLMLLQLPQPRPVSLLISGPPGSGKTALACAMAKAATLPVVQLRLCDIATSSTLAPEKKIADEFFNAVTNGPALVLISQLDQLSKDGGSHGIRNVDKGVARLLSTMMNNLCSEANEERLLVVAECSHVELLDPKLLDCFSEHIVIKPPSASLRRSILQAVCSTETLDTSVDLDYLSLKCSGFLAGDFVRLLRHARRLATKRSLQRHVAEAMKWDALPRPSVHLPNIAITATDFLDALKLVKPTLKKEGFPTVPETTWHDVGGLKDVREELRRKMLDPIKEPDLLAKYNKTSSGILLWGPPGCGKTLLAKAVANEAGVNLLIVNGPDLLSMYQGESERAVRVVFARAASVAPCVIFFDEFDSLCPKRSKTGSESGSKSTIVNTLLTEMSGFMERSGVYVMAATNLPAILDPAVLRPGRFDTLLYVGLPDLDSREAVMKAATKNGTLPVLASDVNLRSIAEQCEHFSGADCRHLVETASTESFEELKAWRKSRAIQVTKSASIASVVRGESSTARSSCNVESSSAEAWSRAEPAVTVTNSLEVNENNQASVPTLSRKEDSNTILSTATDEHLDLSSIKGEDEEWETTDEDKEEVSPSNQLDQRKCTLLTSRPKNGPILNGASAGICATNLISPFPEGEYVVYARHFAAALTKVCPSVSEKERQKYEEQRRLKKFI